MDNKGLAESNRDYENILELKREEIVKMNDKLREK